MANTSFGPFVIAANESNASRRMCYFSLYSASRETVPMTKGQLSVQPVLHIGGWAPISTTSTVRASDATNGLYYLVLTQSETTAVGQAMLRMSNTSIPETTVCLQFVAVDSGDSMRFGLFSQPNFAASTASGLLVLGSGVGGINASGGSVGLVPGVMSGVSVEVKIAGIQVASVGKGAYSGVSVEVATGGIQVASVGAGTYSNVTIQGLSNYANISNVTLAAGTHSGATVQGVSRINSSVTLADALYSKVTFRLDPVDYSGATVGVNNIAAGSYSGVTIQGLGNYANISSVTLSDIGNRSIASSLLSTDMGNNRLVQESLFAMRNRVQIDASTMTVFQTDDLTSAWTASITTGDFPLSGVGPVT